MAPAELVRPVLWPHHAARGALPVQKPGIYPAVTGYRHPVNPELPEPAESPDQQYARQPVTVAGQWPADPHGSGTGLRGDRQWRLRRPALPDRAKARARSM